MVFWRDWDGDGDGEEGGEGCDECCEAHCLFLEEDYPSPFCIIGRIGNGSSSECHAVDWLYVQPDIRRIDAWSCKIESKGA